MLLSTIRKFLRDYFCFLYFIKNEFKTLATNTKTNRSYKALPSSHSHQCTTLGWLAGTHKGIKMLQRSSQQPLENL